MNEEGAHRLAAAVLLRALRDANDRGPLGFWARVWLALEGAAWVEALGLFDLERRWWEFIREPQEISTTVGQKIFR